MRIGNREFDTERRTYIMAILNVTPDSFSDGGSYSSPDDIRRRVREMIEEGADIIDVGGESTRPGYTRISDDEEISRVVPAIECIKAEFDIPVSVDTYKSSVAGAALSAGADLVNDIWGLKADPEMAGVIAESGAACVLMHNSMTGEYKDFPEDCIKELAHSLDIAGRAGIRRDNIILDPGVGFAKTYEENLQVLKHLDSFKRLGFPMLLGSSRKSVIGLTLNLPADERLEGTIVTTVCAVFAGYSFVRVHDVAANVRAAQMAMAIRDS